MKYTLIKYGNRKLYDKQTHKQVTMDSLCELIQYGVDVVVIDYKTKLEVTEAVFASLFYTYHARGKIKASVRNLVDVIRRGSL